MTTKKRITETALKLFNSRGSYAVTTRHIAAEMDISPGNLYYHFRNKEEIIRLILESMIEDFNTVIRPAVFKNDFAGQFAETLSHIGRVMYNYRFFFMEIYTLLEKDPVLKKMYMNIKQERDADFRIIFHFLDKSGLIEQALTDEEFSILRENTWTMAEFLLQSMYINRIKITPENITKKFTHVMYMLRSCLKKEFRDFIK